MTNHTETKEVCCPPVDTALWQEKTFTWQDKPFIRATLRTFFHMPWPPSVGKLMERLWKQAQTAGAFPAQGDFVCLAYDPSPWKCEYYMAVTREVPGADNVKLSGAFVTKVFDGPYSAVPKWIKEMDQYLSTRGQKAAKYYFYYTTCPKCAKERGHNYTVAFAQV